jgi:hypothetical protein
MEKDEQALHKRGDPKSQSTYDKIFHIISHPEYVIKTGRELLVHAYYNSYEIKTARTKLAVASIQRIYSKCNSHYLLLIV